MLLNSKIGYVIPRMLIKFRLNKEPIIKKSINKLTHRSMLLRGVHLRLFCGRFGECRASKGSKSNDLLRVTQAIFQPLAISNPIVKDFLIKTLNNVRLMVPTCVS